MNDIQNYQNSYASQAIFYPKSGVLKIKDWAFFFKKHQFLECQNPMKGGVGFYSKKRGISPPL